MATGGNKKKASRKGARKSTRRAPARASRKVARQARSKTKVYAREVKESRKAPGVKAIRMPGERSFADRRSSLKAGRVSIDPMLWQSTAKLAGEMGVTMPA